MLNQYTPQLNPQSTEQKYAPVFCPALDLFSTSVTNPENPLSNPTLFCVNNAPIICIPPQAGKSGFLYQACCNDWSCPRCGFIRAKHEYGRMLVGSRKLSEDHTLYWVTMTCRGKTLSLADAENGYLDWTHKALRAFQAHVNRAGGFWSYASVTERQPGRGHPHSHGIFTCKPKDTFPITENYDEYVSSVRRIGIKYPEMRYKPENLAEFSFLDLHSEWFALACAKAGLGVQTRISLVDSVEAVPRYMSKYLFKQLNQDKWRPGWRRVRYSNNFPKLPKIDSQNAFPLLTYQDWQRAAHMQAGFVCDCEQTYLLALSYRVYEVTYKT